MSMATNHATLTQCEAKPEHDESVLETLLFLQKSPGGTELVLDPANRASVDTARVTTLLSNNRRRVPMQTRFLRRICGPRGSPNRSAGW